MRSSLARFCARTHAWLEPSSAVARAKSLTFHRSEYVLGFTDRGLEDVGTVWSVNRAVEDGARVGAGDELLQIECAEQPPIFHHPPPLTNFPHPRRRWDGHQVTTADELYHTRWATVDGVASLRAPVGATVVGVNEAALARAAVGKTLDSGEWLVALRVDSDAELRELSDHQAYASRVAEGAPGLFAASELHDQHMDSFDEDCMVQLDGR